MWEWEGLKKVHIPEDKCAKCGKNFVVAPEHRFIDERGRRYCKWSCYNHRNDGKVKIKKTVMAVEQYTQDGVLIAVYSSVKEAANALYCDEEGIRAACNGKHRFSAGYAWKYRKNESF